MTAPAAPDVAGIDETIDVIARVAALQEQPDYDGPRWDQNAWRCGTAMCFAGWRAHLDKAPWAIDPKTRQLRPEIAEAGYDEDDVTSSAIYDPTFPDDDKICTEGPLFSGLPLVHVSDWTRVRLRLDRSQALRLFWGWNGLDDLRRIRDDIADGVTA